MVRFGSVLAVMGGDGAPGDVSGLAVEIARADRAALTFVDVIRDEMSLLSDTEIAARREGLAQAVAAADFAGIAASEALLHGDPAVEVIRMVLREGHDLVLVGEGSGPETVARLLAECPSPVWRIGSPRPERVVAVLPDGHGPDAAQLRALAQSVARGLGGDVAMRAAGGAAGAVPEGALLVLMAQDLALAGAASVLVVKPEDFVSSVTLEAAPQDKDARIAGRVRGKG